VGRVAIRNVLIVCGHLCYDTERTVSMQGDREHVTQHTWQALEEIERAQRETPFCGCGQPTRPIVRAGGIWLECASLQASAGGRIRRLVTLLGPIDHTRRPIVDLAPAAA